MTTTSSAPQPAANRIEAAVAAPSGGAPVPRARRVRRTVERVDPWTVLRLSFVLSLALAVVTVVAIMLLWALLASGGVFSSIEASAHEILGDSSLTFTQYFEFGRVFLVALILAVCDVVLMTAGATIGAFLFNLATSISGGLEISVTEEH